MSSDGEGKPTSPASKVHKIEPKFRDEHHEIFMAQDMHWPPNVAAELGPSFASLTERQGESLCFMNKRFPPMYNAANNLVCKDQVLKLPLEFLDLNPRLPRLISWPKCNSPWSHRIPTLTGKSLIVARYSPFENKEMHFTRPLHGKTLFAMGGWTREMWKPSTPEVELEDHDLLTSLAGNMFSAFAFGPAFMTVLALAGATSHNFRSIQNAAVCADEQDTEAFDVEGTFSGEYLDLE